jgi:Protein of unknown function (DUF2874).
MKKFKTVLTAIVMLFTFSAFATEPVKVSPVVKAAFQNDFSKANDVKWESTEGFYFASFTLNDETVEAAYTEKGELVGTSRRITREQIPLSISIALGTQYEGYEVAKSVIELTYENVTRYYVTVSNKKETVSLKCYSNGDMNVERRTKK